MRAKAFILCEQFSKLEIFPGDNFCPGKALDENWIAKCSVTALFPSSPPTGGYEWCKESFYKVVYEDQICLSQSN